MSKLASAAWLEEEVEAVAFVVNRQEGKRQTDINCGALA